MKNLGWMISLVLLWAFMMPNLILAAVKAGDLLKGMETVTETQTDITAKVEMTQEKAGEGIRIYNAIYYRNDADNSFLIVMTAPESEKGNGYLRQGENFWMYRRNTRTFQHVNRDESIAGTDSKGQDFENKKLTELYKPATDASGKEKMIETKLGDVPVYQLEVTAKIEDVSYPKEIYWIRKDNFLPLKIQSYSLSGTLMQTSYFLKYIQIEGKYVWIKAMFIDEFEKGNKTLIEVQNISLKKIDNYVFTKAYLENLSK